MPRVAMDKRDGKWASNNMDSSPTRGNSLVHGSPRTSDHMSHGNKAHRRQNSIERFYLGDDLEVDSSSNGTRSPPSFGEELRIDPGEVKAGEVLKGGDGNQKGGGVKRGDESSDRKSKKSFKSRSSSIKSSSSKKSSRPPLLLPEWDSSIKANPKKIVTPEKVVPKDKKQSNVVVSAKNGSRSVDGMEDPSEAGLDNPDLGPFLLKHARNLISSGEDPRKALNYALRAAKSFEKCYGGKPSLDLVMCLHVIAAINTNLGQYDEAIPLLERSIEIPIQKEGHDYALAKFSGYMQLGDIYAMLGQLESSIKCYTSGLEVQREALGDHDPRVGETCRYLAEAHMQAMQLDEAESLCQMALEIHREQCLPGSPEETADRRLLGLICDTKGDYESALEHLVLASMGMMSSGQDAEVASIDCSIGDIYLALARYEEAVFAYQKALTVFKTTKGENHPMVASVFVRLADLYNKTGKFRESNSYCENALRIYGKPTAGTPSEEIASGLTDISAIYESMEEPEHALKLLQKALKLYDDAPGRQSTIAGIEAQMGVLYYITGNYEESYASFKNAITKLRACGEKKSAFFGIALNQMGLSCVQLYSINEAAELFEEARSILEEEYGPYHPDTLGVYSNLAGTYDAMGRLDEAIKLLEHVVVLREEKLGTASPEVDDEKRRLTVLLKEAGRRRHRKTRSLEMLFDGNSLVRKNNAHV